MRYLTISHLRPGMVLAQPLYGANFNILLRENSVLNASNIQRINEMGYAGIYIADELSHDIDIEDVISQDLRIQIIKSAKETLAQAEASILNPSKVVKVRQDKVIVSIMDTLIGLQRRLVDMIDLKPYDDYEYYHSANVVILSMILGVELGLYNSQLYELGIASLLHDVGNTFIPKEILGKPGKLTPDEFDVIKKHTQIGFDYLRDNFDISIEGCMGALHHHENYDGTGYPNRLKQDKISIYGRIIAITDVYDALTSRRPYRQAMFPPAAMEFLDMNAGTMFDPEIVKAFQQVVSMYPAGFCVELSTGAQCIVVENYQGDTSRPRVRLLRNMSRTPMYVDLHKDAAFEKALVSHIIEV